MGAMGRYFIELQEQEIEAAIEYVHNQQQVSEEEKSQIDKYEQEDFDRAFPLGLVMGSNPIAVTIHYKSKQIEWKKKELLSLQTKHL